MPVHATTLADLAAPPATGLRLTWMGHSSVLAEIDGRRVLFDPVWGERCSPFPFVGPKRLHPVPVPLTTLGDVDVVVISHDHYDHLDLPTIRALAGTGTVFAVPLGVGAHLERWGVAPDRLRELDWNETAKVNGISLTATPRATSATVACGTTSTPCGPPGPSGARSTASTTAAIRATSPASGTSAPSTAPSTPR